MKLFWHELKAQQKLFWRSRELAFFTFALPLILYLLLGSVNENDQIEGVRGADYLLAGMIGYGLASTAFAGLAIMLVIRREGRILKRLRATPLPASTYVGAVLVSILIVFGIESALLMTIGKAVFSAEIPDQLVSVVLMLLLGSLSFAALGVGVSTLIRSADAAAAAVNAIYLPMSFLSGSFFSPKAFPAFLEAIGSVLPLTYFIELARNIMLHGQQIWENGSDVAIVAAWGLAGLVVAVRRFSWEAKES
jgi:ABC-2 type transport system permease protein